MDLDAICASLFILTGLLNEHPNEPNASSQNLASIKRAQVISSRNTTHYVLARALVCMWNKGNNTRARKWRQDSEDPGSHTPTESEAVFEQCTQQTIIIIISSVRKLGPDLDQWSNQGPSKHKEERARMHTVRNNTHKEGGDSQCGRSGRTACEKSEPGLNCFTESAHSNT